MHLAFSNDQECVLYDVKYVPTIKRSLFFVDQIDIHGYKTTFERRSWKLTKGSKLASRNKARVFVLLAWTLTGKFVIVAKAE